MGVGTPQGNAAYEPDAFVAAIKRAHDKLNDIKTELREQNTRQAERDRQLRAREEAVTFREKRVAAHEQLLELKPAKGRRWKYTPRWLRD